MSPISPAVTRRNSSRWYMRSTRRRSFSDRSMPRSSKKPITTCWGSSGLRRTVRPARLPRRRTWWRVTGTVASSRSVTLTPTELHPTMRARLSTRATRLVSREAVMYEPFSKPDAHALAKRTANSGLMSTLAIPCTPPGPKRLREPPDSQTIEALTWAPASTTLPG